MKCSESAQVCKILKTNMLSLSMMLAMENLIAFYAIRKLLVIVLNTKMILEEENNQSTSET